jgi:hypothetical protein
MSWADTCVSALLGLEGKAGSTVSLDDEWGVVGGDAAAPAETTVNEEKEKLASSDSEKPVSHQSESVSDEGLSLVVKLLLGGVIVAACVVFIKAFATRHRTGGKGVYEKVGA